MKKKVSRKNTRGNTLTKEINIDNIKNKFLNEADIIVNEIIEKIISFSISTDFRKNIEKNIPDSCFNFLRSAIDSYLNLNFISFDKEESNSKNLSIITEKNDLPEFQGITPILDTSYVEKTTKNNSEQIEPSFEEQIFFKNILKGENNWDLMDEPSSNKYDRYATTLVKFQEIEKDWNKYNKKEILEKIDEENENNSDINYKKTNENIESKKLETTRKKSIKRLSRLSKLLIFDNNANNDNRIKKRNLNDIMSQFSFHDLDDSNDIYKEPKNINYEKLRKEVQEKQKEENEEKKIKKNAKNDIENKIKLAAEKNKQYAGKKITVDSNGEIVFIKGIKLEKLSKDFITMRTMTKLVRDEEKAKEAEKNKSKNKIKKRKTVSINNNLTLANNNGANNEVINNEKKQEKDKNNNEKQNEINKNEENTENKLLKGKSQRLPKIRGGRFKPKENPEELYKQKLLKRIEEGPIILSGSNFDIMSMEVGVSIKEKDKFKSGGKDFYHKFNKFSLDNYNKQLKDTLQINSFIKTQTENENYNKSDVNNYITNIVEGYNSSINFTNNNSNLNLQTANSNKNFFTDFNTVSNFGNLSINKSKNSSLSPKLKLSGTGLSLRVSMDKLNLISERQEKLTKKIPNIFKKKFFNFTSNKFSLPKLEEINKFSSEILTSSDWMTRKGVNNTIGTPFRKPEKPGFQEIMRETGFNGKIFRERNKNISTNTNFKYDFEKNLNI